MTSEILLMELFAFYNVENLFLPDTKPMHKLDPTVSGLWNWDKKRYRNKLYKLSNAFSMLKQESNVLPFLIGLSEISGRKVLEDLVSLSPFNSEYGIVHYNSMDERKVDVALLYDKNKVEILHSEPITFFFEIEDNNPENYDTTRDVLYAKVKFREEIMHVFVLHLPSKREKDINLPKRNFILKEIRQKIQTIIKEEDAKVILCGDFNENPDEENIQNLLLDDSGGVLMRNPFEALFRARNYSAFHYKSGLLFDQILLSEHFFSEKESVFFQDAGIFKPEQMKSSIGAFVDRPYRTYAGTRYLGGYSDHFPVFIILRNRL